MSDSMIGKEPATSEDTFSSRIQSHIRSAADASTRLRGAVDKVGSRYFSQNIPQTSPEEAPILAFEEATHKELDEIILSSEIAIELLRKL